ncbi:MAG: helix-turn-helix domain-containing protein [Candidatus Freyarchaeota archaeon]
MSSKQISRELLEQFGLSGDEINVYLAALGLGEFSLSDLVNCLALPFDVVSKIVNRLVEIGFLRRVPGSVEHYVVLEPFLEFFVSFYEKIGRELQSLREEILSSFDEASRSIQAFSGMVVREASRFFADEAAGLEEFTGRMCDEYGRMVEEGKDFLRGIVVSVEELLEELLSTFMVKMRDVERFEGKAVSLSEAMSDFLKRIDEGTRATIDAQVKLIGALQSDVRRRLDGLAVQMREALENHYRSHVKTVDELVAALGELFSKEIEGLRSFVEKQEMEANWLVETLAVKIGGFIRSIGNKYVQIITESFQRRSELTQGLLFKIEELVDKVTTIAEELKELSRGRRSFIGRFGASRLRAALRIWASEAEKVSGEVKEILRQIVEGEEAEKRSNEELIEEILGRVEEDYENVKSAFSGMKREVEERIGVAPEIFETRVTSEINSALLRSTRSCEDTTNILLTILSEESKSLIEELISSLASYAKEVAGLLTSYVKEAVELVKLVEYSALLIRRKAAKIMQEKAYEYDKRGEELVENVVEKREALLEEFNSKLDGRKEDFNREVLREAESASGVLKRAVDNFKQVIDELHLKISENVEILEDVWQTSLDVSPVYTGTWIVKGKEAVVNHMVSMLRRARGKAVLVLPQPVHEVLEAASKVGSNVAVKLAVKTAVETPIIRELSFMENVEVYLCPDADFWGAIIDEKEVLIAPVDPDGTLVATVSEREGPVKVYGRLIMKFFADKLMRKVKEKEVEERKEVI